MSCMLLDIELGLNDYVRNYGEIIVSIKQKAFIFGYRSYSLDGGVSARLRIPNF